MRIGQGQKTPKFLLLAGVGLKIKALHVRHFRGLDRDHLSRVYKGGQILGDYLDQKKAFDCGVGTFYLVTTA